MASLSVTPHIEIEAVHFQYFKIQQYRILTFVTILTTTTKPHTGFPAWQIFDCYQCRCLISKPKSSSQTYQSIHSNNWKYKNSINNKSQRNCTLRDNCQSWLPTSVLMKNNKRTATNNMVTPYCSFIYQDY